MYLHNLCVSIDQLANTLLAGYPDETLSSCSYRCRDKKRWAIMVKVINFLAHGIKSIERCIMYTRLHVDENGIVGGLGQAY